MKPTDSSLQKLLNAAARAHEELPESAPFAVEAVVMAQWRGAQPEDEFALFAMLFRRAVVFAAIVILVSLAWNRFETKSHADTTALASYAMMQLPP